MRYLVAAALMLALVVGGIVIIAAPVATVPVQQAAATAYLAAASTDNDALAAATKLCPGPTATNPQLIACYRAYSVADQEFVKAVKAINFPPEMQAAVNALVQANTRAAAADKALAESADPLHDSTDFVASQQAHKDGVAAASLILGIPAAPLGTATPTP